MGGWHCIPSSCGRVVYQEYLPASIRYRYPEEEWIYVGGDFWTIEVEQSPWYGGQNPDKTYNVLRYAQARWDRKGNFLGYSGDYIKELSPRPQAPIQAIRLEFEHLGSIYSSVDGHEGNNIKTSRTIFNVLDATGTYRRVGDIYPVGGARVLGFVPSDGIQEPPTEKCIFTIFKNGEIVHQETRNVCPEVEKLDARLSDERKTIEIKKTPWLSDIEILEFAKDAEHVEFVPYPIQVVRGIPAECLNIYRNEIFDPFPDADPDDPNSPVFGDYIAQICSAPGSPPPEYEVICNCGCESCPPGTCPLICGDRVCCYDDYGKSIKEIPIAEYCGD